MIFTESDAIEKKRGQKYFWMKHGSTRMQLQNGYGLTVMDQGAGDVPVATVNAS
jgi:hypothetical protein